MPPDLAAADSAHATDPAAGFAARDTTAPSGRLTLAPALAQALLGSPDLAAYGFDIRSAEARTLQAGYRPNPEVTTYIEDFGGNRDRGGFRGYQGTLSLSQVVELGGKRAQRLRLARMDESLAAWDYEARRLDVLTNTLRAFAEVLAAQRKVGLARETLATEQRFFGAVAERVRAGQVSPLEQDRAQVALSNGRIVLAAATRDLAAARSRLAVQWGGREASFDSAEGDLDRVSPPPSLPVLLALAAENPDVARWRAEVQQREARLAVERSKNVPDVTLDGGVRRYGDGGTAFVGGVTVAIPVFGLNRGNEMDAQAQLDRGRVQARAAGIRAAADLRQAFERLSRAYDEVGLLRREVLPAAQSAYDGTDVGYRGGKYSLLDVLDAQRSLTDARVRLVDALAAYQGAAHRPPGRQMMRATTLIALALVAKAFVAPASAEQPEKQAPVVKLSAEQRTLIELKVEPARPGRVSDAIVLNGEVTADQERTVTVASRVAGIVRDVPARVGDRVRSGATLAIMESAAGAEAEAAYAAARSKVGLADAQAAREQALFSKRVSPQQDLQVARQAAAEAAIGLREADRKMRLLGLDPARGGQSSAGAIRLAVTAPFDGTLIDRKVAAGDQVGEGAALFQLADLDRVWVIAAVFERDIAQLRVGEPADVTLAAYPGRTFHGRLAWMSDVIDERSRTLSVRVELENAGRLLRPGSFAQVSVATPQAPGTLVVPADAVLRGRADRIVFVQIGDGAYQRREVKLGGHSPDAVEIVSGLGPGELVVTNGAFALLSELLKSSFGGDDD